MGGLARTMRYHYSLRLRTRLSYRERLICCTATSGAWRGSGSCVCLLVVDSWFSMVVAACTVARACLWAPLCRPLPRFLLRTDSGGEFDWGGTSVKR